MAFRRRKFFEFDDAFPDFGNIEKMFEEMLGEMDALHAEDLARPGKPLVYGFSMHVGPDGKPRIEEFGNVSSKQQKIKGEREPLVDVIDGEKEVTVIAELPGVDKNEVRLNCQKNSLSISVADPERRFRKELKLPAEVDAKSAKAKLKNGMLEVVLTKLKPSPPKEKGSEVKVD